MWLLWLRQGQRSGGAGGRYNNFVRASVVPDPEIPAGNDILAYKDAAGLPPSRSASRRGLGSYWPTAPSIRWRSRSTWPLCRAHSSTMCTETQYRQRYAAALGLSSLQADEFINGVLYRSTPQSINAINTLMTT